MSDISFRMAEKGDVPFLARTISQVSAGVVELLLEGALPAVSSLHILEMVLRDASSHFSFENCVLAEENRVPMGLLFAYDAREQAIPPLMRVTLDSSRITPLEDLLTCHVPESLYINTFWVDEKARGMGLSDTLMDYAKEWSHALGYSKISLFVFRDNERARAFYFRHGFRSQREISLSPELKSLHGAGDLFLCEF